MESVVKHLPNTYYLELRQDYITLCSSLTYRKSEKSKSSPHCKALILAVMEKWTNEKIRKKKDPRIYMTYAQWSEEMYGMFGRWVILDSLDELAEEELLIREKCRINGRESYSYLLNVHCLNKKLAELPHLQIDATDGNVDATYLQVDATDLKIDGTSSSPASKSRHFIESDTQNQNIKSTKKDDRAKLLTSEQLLIDDFYCHLAYKPKPPKITEKLIEYWDSLVPCIHTQEDMNSLYEYTAKDCAKKTDTRVYPGNLADCRSGWQQEQERNSIPVLPQPQPKEVYEPVQRKSEPLPVDMQMWMVDTANEFGEDETVCVNELEWCFQHTTCTEEEFYSKLIRAYGIAEKSKCIDTLFAEIKQSLLLIVEAAVI